MINDGQCPYYVMLDDLWSRLLSVMVVFRKGCVIEGCFNYGFRLRWMFSAKVVLLKVVSMMVFVCDGCFVFCEGCGLRRSSVMFCSVMVCDELPLLVYDQ